MNLPDLPADESTNRLIAAAPGLTTADVHIIYCDRWHGFPYRGVTVTQADMDERFVAIVANLVDVGKVAAGLIAVLEDQ